MTSEKIHENKVTRLRHWPTMFLGVVVAVIFLVAFFSFQVKSTEFAIVTTLGEITAVKDAGLHFRWPFPIQKIHYFDNRWRCFDGNVGKIEETYTADGKNIIVGIYTVYRIKEPETLFKSVETIEEAENKLNSLMRTVKDGVMGRHNFDELINTDPAKMKLKDIETEIKNALKGTALNQYGLEIKTAGIKSLGVPEGISEKVFERMKEERKRAAQEYRSQGERIAKEIRDKADNERKIKLADAEAEAKRIRAEGDAKAAAYYAVFKEEPKLAAFLRKLDALRKTVEKKTTLILDTDSAPFDLLKLDSEKLKSFGNNKSETTE